jgi:putative ABC transport system substrate-binding protein
MRRREFITLLGSAAAVWPLAGRAQQPERVRRIGVLFSLAVDDTESVARRAAFEQALKALGWINGGNVRIDYRWAGSDLGLVPNLSRNWSPRRQMLS